MSLLKILQQAKGGKGLKQIADSFGIDPGQAESLAQVVAPSLGRAASKRAQGGGLESIVDQLMGEKESVYFDKPERATKPQGRAQGERFIDELLGSQEARKTLADRSAEKTGLDVGIVEQLLPALGAVLQGGMQKNLPDRTLQGAVGRGGPSTTGGGLLGAITGALTGSTKRRQQAQQDGLGALTQMFDADGDGSIIDDVLESMMSSGRR